VTNCNLKLCTTIRVFDNLETVFEIVFETVRKKTAAKVTTLSAIYSTIPNG